MAATFDITSPDGQKYTVNGPDGATKEQAFAILQQHLGTQKTSPITTNSLVREAATGVPIVGGLLNKAEAATNAGLSYLLNPLFDEKDQLTGSLGERYSKSLAEQNATDEAFEQQHPVASTAAQVVGGTAATLPFAGVGGALPAGVTRAGQTALGMGGRTLLGQMGRSAASGAGINAADALVRGNDPGVAAITGGAIGAVAPPIARGLAAAAQPVVNTYQGIINPANRAMRLNADAVQRAQALSREMMGAQDYDDFRTLLQHQNAGAQLTPQRQARLDDLQQRAREMNLPLTPEEFDAAQAQGVPVNLMDVGGEPGRALARSAANVSPEGRAIMNNAIDQRFQSQAERFRDWFAGTRNFPTQASRNAAIDDVRTRVYQPAYETAWHDQWDTQLWPDQELADQRAEDWNRFQDLSQRSNMGPPLNAQERATLRNLQARRGGNGPPQAYSQVQLRALDSLEELSQAPEVQKAMQLANIENKNWAVLEGRNAPQNPLRGAVPEGAPPGTASVVNPTDTRSGSGNLPSLWWWDRVKRALDASNDGTAQLYARNLRNALDTLVPSYAQARAAAQPHLWFDGAPNAYEAGRNFLNRGARLGPDAQQQLGRMDPVERQLFEDGYADELNNRIVGNTADRRTITNKIFNTPNVRAEVTTALGPQRANQIEARLRLEGLMDTARQAVQGNSTSVRQLVELGLAGGTGVIEGGNPMNWDSSTIMHAAMMYGAARGYAHVDQRIALQVARLLTSQDPAQIRMAMQMVTRNPVIMNSLRLADVALSRAGATTARMLQQ